MKLGKFLASGVIGMSLSLAPGMKAAEAEAEVKVNLPKAEVHTEVKQESDATGRIQTETTPEREKIRGSNKASGLIGMEVRNNDQEKLGEIKDLVMDLHSGKISYAVLAVGGFLGIGEKLIALPPGTLQVATDHSHLLLNADKARIQAAPGFAATAWPLVGEVHSSSFWNEASGAAGGIETSKTTGVDADVDIDRDRKRVETEVKLDKKDPIYTDADHDKNPKVKVETK